MPGFTGRTKDEHCFTLPSAKCARRLAVEAGWDKRRQDCVAEAITLNPNAAVRTPTLLPAAEYVNPSSSARLSARASKPPSPAARILSRHEGVLINFSNES